MSRASSAPGAPRLIFSDDLTGYDFGPDHAMAPGRVADTIALARALGVLDHLEVVPPPPANRALLELVHHDDYIAAVELGIPDPVYGLGTHDNPITHDMHEVTSLIVAASVEAARSVWSGEVRRATNISGGLHHAMPGLASGFCIYNDVAVAIAWLLAQGAERVAYVDIDVHHGDGVQAVFYDDPRVLTVSLHESPQTLFPGTGWPHETGGPHAIGSAVNVALPAGTGDAGWLRAFDAIVPPVLTEFAPQVLITQHGCDSHRHDPLADLRLSLDGQRQSYLMLAELTDRTAAGWVSTGGGGYAVREVVPRAWTHLLGIVAGHPVDPQTEIPQEWRDAVGEGAPTMMTDGVEVSFARFDDGFDPGSRLDQAVIATRKAVFPDHGLDPGL